MPAELSVGDVAPNFDLASTEDAVLMLRDEVPRTAVLLYFFADPSDEAARRDLRALSAVADDLVRRCAKAMAVSPAQLDDLKSLQRELGLAFPLLHDDRGFSAHYGVVPDGDDSPPRPALVVVDRRQQVVWMANPIASVEEAMPEVAVALRQLGRPTGNYPRSVLNRLVDWWVN